jgi:hypothetical protein
LGNIFRVGIKRGGAHGHRGFAFHDDAALQKPPAPRYRVTRAMAFAHASVLPSESAVLTPFFQ